ncbi:MAG: pyridoxal-phosphate dependent enzyme [Bacteroidota bacterium]|nr:pyridoxal-phosphate dependent enzyme [Bacteroidota bacterium]
MMQENLQNVLTQPSATLSSSGISVDMLRLDLLHPVVSGNKWFKLKEYLSEAREQQKKVLATFGGAYSNHIVATAFAAKESGMQSIGFIRGEPGKFPSHSLLTAESYGMEIRYISRNAFRDTAQIMKENDHPSIYWIREGGYGILGAKGAATILNLVSLSDYSDIACATGTGTMLAGLLKSALPNQRLTGIPVLNNADTIRNEIHQLLTTAERQKNFSLQAGYTFGGYARHTPLLLESMRSLWEAERIPSDFVYTGKLFFAVKDLVSKGYFAEKSKVLVIHSGGLQGNASLPLNTLPF